MLVERHGGKVEAHSAGPGQGSEFVVRLPLGPATADESSTPALATSRQEAGVLRLLVVDDNQDAADTTAMLLQVIGHQCSVAYSGAAGLELALADPPDAVILDIGLPDLDGYEVAKRLRQEDRGKSVPLIALTGYGRDADRELSTSAGFDAHIVKPVDMQKLQQVVTTIARQRGGYA
jgi:DNA-binding response OmpR family regulator